MKMTDKIRNLRPKADKYLELFPAIVLLGVRQCGKTTLAKQLRSDWHYFDMEKSSDFEFITEDFDFFFHEYPGNLIIDEAQQSPQLFKELRSVIDADRNRNGRFILTGSSSPELIRQITESLAGRVGILEVAPMKMNEIHEKPVSGIYNLIINGINNESADSLKTLKIIHSHDEVLDKFLYGGYPYPVLRENPLEYGVWMENYFRTYLHQDIRARYPRLNNAAFSRFLKMLSQLSGSILNKNDIGRSLNCSEMTVSQYLDIADGTYLWRSLLSYERSISKSIVKRPKGHLRDSGLTNFLLGINTREKLITHPRVGNLFEAFIIEEILQGMESTLAVNWQPWYFRTKNGAEVDLILEGTFGILPIEIKFGMSSRKSDLISLNQFVMKNDLPLGIVINNASEIKRISERIVQIPAGVL